MFDSLFLFTTLQSECARVQWEIYLRRSVNARRPGQTVDQSRVNTSLAERKTNPTRVAFSGETMLNG